MKRKSESVNAKAKALLDLICPAYIPEAEIPEGYMSADEVARLNGFSERCVRERLSKLHLAGKVNAIRVKRRTGKICNYYSIK